MSPNHQYDFLPLPNHGDEAIVEAMRHWANNDIWRIKSIIDLRIMTRVIDGENSHFISILWEGTRNER